MKATGKDAYLWGKSVVTLLGLTPTDPARIWVAFPSRVRRDIGAGSSCLACVRTRPPRTTKAFTASAPSTPSAPPPRGSGTGALRAAAGRFDRAACGFR